jgi:hypothetical protein
MPTKRYNKLITSVLLTEEDWQIARFLMRNLGFRSFSALVSHLLHKECMANEKCYEVMTNRKLDEMIVKGRTGGGGENDVNFR